VAATIINAIQNIIYSQGFVENTRRIAVIGSLGNIGRFLLRQLNTLMVEPVPEHLYSVDLKINPKYVDPRPKPEWVPSSIPEELQGLEHRESFSGNADGPGLPLEVQNNISMVIGVSAGPTKDHVTFSKDHMFHWLIQSPNRDLFLASGSSKTVEFADIYKYFQDLFPGTVTEVTVDILGHKAVVTKRKIHDVLTNDLLAFGSLYQFDIEIGGKTVEHNVWALFDLLPVNFLYFGVPTEIIDYILAQLVSATVALSRQPGLKPHFYAVDYSHAATDDVFDAKKFTGPDYPLPLPSGTDFSAPKKH